MGLYLGGYEQTLRFYAPDGQLVPTPEESAENAQREVDTERRRNETLMAKLRSLGVDPDAED